jgi:hypothetical protein
MLWYKSTAIALAFTMLLPAAGYADPSQFSAFLDGFEEIPAILSGATATLKLSADADSVAYELSYTSGFSSAVTQSHIHFGKEHVAGGFIAFLCTNLGNGPAGTQSCPAAPATITGTLTAASIIGPTVQNIPVGDFAGLIAALQSDTAYVNIHTVNFPAGEIRSQIQTGLGAANGQH